MSASAAAAAAGAGPKPTTPANPVAAPSEHPKPKLSDPRSPKKARLSKLDPSTFADRDAAQVKHVNLNLVVDFASKQLRGLASLQVHLEPACESITLDTSELTIGAITVEGVPVTPQFPAEDFRGRQLAIPVPPAARTAAKGDVVTVDIVYNTSASASAVQWLPAEQTSGKQHPFLFTQCEPIHARSLFPSQDTPGVKFTYSASLSTPRALTALMTASRSADVQPTPGAAAAWPQAMRDALSGVDLSAFHTTTFVQDRPIPSYLMAIVVGELEGQAIAPGRVTIWAEKPQLAKAVAEFQETEEMMQLAEEVCGPFRWASYELVLMPPSFPYGGMEGQMTLVTPTLLTGDRSLVNVVAHEIAHSWTGNLVTNRSWEHFWLNEGFTVFVERKIKAKRTSLAEADLDALEGVDDLRKAMKQMEGTPSFTQLVPDLTGKDPDEAFSTVPYEKGFIFLRYLESLCGEPAFASWLKTYLAEFADRAIDSSTFRDHIVAHFAGSVDLAAAVDWNQWFFAPFFFPDMQKVVDSFDGSLRAQANKLAALWAASASVATADSTTAAAERSIAGWSSAQTCGMLQTLLADDVAPLSAATIEQIDAMYHFSQSANSEILFRWIQLALKAEWKPILEQATSFASTKGRMKFCRPIYRLMHKSKAAWAREAAQKTFELHSGFYHPIARKMIAQDLAK